MNALKGVCKGRRRGEREGDLGLTHGKKSRSEREGKTIIGGEKGKVRGKKEDPRIYFYRCKGKTY